jgi:hypothetical protein
MRCRVMEDKGERWYCTYGDFFLEAEEVRVLAIVSDLIKEGNGRIGR